MTLPSFSEVSSTLTYHPDTGVFLRKPAGAPAGGPNSKGFYTISVGGKQYVATRVAWVLMTGQRPEKNVVFINGDRGDLRWCNLRLAGDLPEVTAERVREVFDYNPETGELTYRRTRGGTRSKGDAAGWICRRSLRRGGGYRVTSFNGREYGVHQLVWLWWHGRAARGHIDHINLDRADNRIENLRECSPSENMANRRKQANNSSGLKGVSYHKAAGKWRATIKLRHLGLFETPEAAHAAYCAAAADEFGEFARGA